MNEQKNTLKFNHFFFLWFGAAVSVAEILTGGLLAPLGFKTGLLVIIIGHLLGTTLLVLGGIIGTQERLPALVSTRISFGAYGSYLFSLLNILQLVGWTAIMVMAAAKSSNELTKAMWGFDAFSLWNIIIGALVLLWIALGREGGWKKVNSVAVILLLGVTLVLSHVVFHDASLFNIPPSGGMSFGEGVELCVVMPLSWLPLIADYTRFAKNKKSAALGSWAGYFIGSCWMFIIGLGAAIVADNAEPSAIMLSAGLGLSALAIIVLATVTTTFMDAYSAGVSLSNIFPKINETHLALIITVIGTLLALALNMEQYEDFLMAIGSVFAPLFAILFTDYFSLKNRNIEKDLLINWTAIIVWVLGVVLYYQFLKLDLFVGATLPVMLLTACIYRLLSACAITFRYLKNQS
ncbi:MAG: hydroxymethylpyrimidine transporter CytX [Firmicutes bacterium]|nr:hydroxymethylpyrimidine transporter CytX [Bacillota bacterium]